MFIQFIAAVVNNIKVKLATLKVRHDAFRKAMSLNQAWLIMNGEKMY